MNETEKANSYWSLLSWIHIYWKYFILKKMLYLLVSIYVILFLYTVKTSRISFVDNIIRVIFWEYLYNVCLGLLERLCVSGSVILAGEKAPNLSSDFPSVFIYRTLGKSSPRQVGMPARWQDFRFFKHKSDILIWIRYLPYFAVPNSIKFARHPRIDGNQNRMINFYWSNLCNLLNCNRVWVLFVIRKIRSKHAKIWYL